LNSLSLYQHLPFINNIVNSTFALWQSPFLTNIVKTIF
jgi:hypothetical protein